MTPAEQAQTVVAMVTAFLNRDQKTGDAIQAELSDEEVRGVMGFMVGMIAGSVVGLSIDHHWTVQEVLAQLGVQAAQL